MAEQQFTTEELNSEEWKTISDFEMYEVSTLGRVRRVIDCRASKKGRVLKPGLPAKGYAQISLVKKKVYTKTVHGLVARAFLGEPPSLKHHINHKNGNKHDARLLNLEYCTPSENVQHSMNVLGNRLDGEYSPVAKLTAATVLAIHQDMMNAVSPADIMEKHGVSETQLYRIKKRQSWQKLLSDLPSNYPSARRRQPFYKLSVEDIKQIKQRIAAGETNQQIAKDYPIKSDSTIQFIRIGTSWKHITPD